MKILIAEDEAHLAEGLRFNLELEGYETTVAENGGIALKKLAEERFDAVVLDVMMPEVDGFEVAISLREKGDYTPILMLTALGNPEDVLNGFEAGADDYLPKPFDLNIFLARVKALLRRRKWQSSPEKHAPVSTAMTVNGKTIDLENFELRADGKPIPLTVMEANLLKYLIDHEGSAVSRKTILEEVWKLHIDTDTRAIDNFIVRLRRLIEDEPYKPKILQTVRGVGYKFVRPE
jgi:DNA-binding response OmpR family regulator